MAIEDPVSFVKSTVRHELVNDITIITGYEEDDRPLSELHDLLEDDSDSSDDFSPETIGKLKEEIEEVKDGYSSPARERAERVTTLLDSVKHYLEFIEEGERSSMVSVGELMSPMEEFVDWYGGEINYNGLGDTKVKGNDSYCFVTSTIGKNFEDHVIAEGFDDSELYAEVREESDSTSVYIWDTGPGLRDASELFDKKEDGSGFGMYMAREVMDYTDATIEVLDSVPFQDEDEEIGLAYRLQFPKVETVPEKEPYHIGS